jgi:hypothetical protein
MLILGTEIINLQDMERSTSTTFDIMPAIECRVSLRSNISSSLDVLEVMEKEEEEECDGEGTLSLSCHINAPVTSEWFLRCEDGELEPSHEPPKRRNFT